MSMLSIMKSSNFPADEESISYVLRQGEEAKHRARDMVDRYMLSTDSKMDGTLHPGLDTTNPQIRLDTKSHQWIEEELKEDLDL